MIIDATHPVSFKSNVEGIECTIRVTHYLPAEPAITSGPMENAEEAIPAEFEFEARDLAFDQLLDIEISDEEADRIFDEFEAYLLAQKHGKDF